MTESLQTLFWYALAVIGIVGGILGLSFLLGERHQAPAMRVPYESGIAPTSSSRLRIPIQFYLIAMLFVIFDLEMVFIFAWAVVVREAGWLGFFEMAVFIAMLLIALIYLWRVGALEWRNREPESSLTETR